MNKLALLLLAGLAPVGPSDGLVSRAAAAASSCVGPVAPQPTWSVDGAQVSGGFGAVVMTAGDVNGDGFSDLLVASPTYDNAFTDAGRVVLYLGSAAGLGSVAAWWAEGDKDSASFGASLSPAGDVNGDGYADVVIGAPGAGSLTRGGRAYLYRGTAAGLSPTPAWTISGSVPLAALGGSVAGLGDVDGDGYADVAVSSPGYANGETGEGRVQVFMGSSADLSLFAVWSVEGEQAGAALGSVASAGDVNGDGYDDVVVGAPAYDGGQVDEGRALVYLGSAAGLASTAVWSAEGDVVGGAFGAVVATAGDVNGDGYADILVGAPSFSNGQDGEGRATLYLGTSAGPSAGSAWLVESHQVGAATGASLGPAGDVNGDGYADVVVGSSLADVTLIDEGRVSVYLGSAAGLDGASVWTFASGQAGAQFGAGSATAGDVNGDGFSDVVAGAPHYGGGTADAGRVLVFGGCGEKLNPSPDWVQTGQQAGENFGFRSASAGDVNGDGYDDVIIASQLYDDTQPDEGRAWLYLGSAIGLGDSAVWYAQSGQDSARFGASASGAGDVNGDGYGDVIIGCPDCEADLSHQGQLSLFYGSPTGLSPTPAWTPQGRGIYAELGVSSAGVGDVNGDGYADVAAGWQYYSGAGWARAGAAMVWHGGPFGPSTTPSWTGIGKQDSAQYGVKVAGAGDVNGDGYSDLLVGAWHWTIGQLRWAGAAFLYMGGPNGLDSTAAWANWGDQQGAQYGLQASTAGDVNGDGYADVLIGANGYPYPYPFGGRAYLYLGSATGLSETPAWTFSGDRQHSFLGTVGPAGDVNGDGYADVVISAPMYDEIEADEGIGYLFLGSPDGLPAQPDWSFQPNKDIARFGEAAETAGDVNGDGFADVIFGADGLDAPLHAQGGAFLWYGNGQRGLPRLVGQARVTGAAPIQPLGMSDAATSFRLRALGRSAAGRGRVRLEWELTGVGSGVGNVAGMTGYRDTGAPQPSSGSVYSFDELVTGLESYGAYRWRCRIAGTSPFFPHTPWLSLADFFPYGAADIRMGGVTGIGPRGQGAALAVPRIDPNPVRGPASVSYTLPDGDPRDVRLAVYDVAGRRVATLLEARESGGPHVVSWTAARGARPLPAGVYVLRLSAGALTASTRFVVTR